MLESNQRITFTGSHGEPLAARLDAPEQTAAPRGFALFAHCFSCSKDVLTATRLSAALNARGIALLRFDFTGLGNSQGDFANTNFSSNVADLLRAADYLRQHHEAPKILIGHSLGGAAALAAAGEIPEVRAVATLAAPSDPAHVSHLFADQVTTIEAQGEAEVQLAGRPFRIQRQFLADIAEQRLLDKVARLRKPLLLFHSPRDATVDIAHAAEIYAAAKHPKSFVSLDDADHMTSRPQDAEFVAGILSAWAGRYIDDKAPLKPEPTAEGEVTVSETGGGKFSQTIRAGRHAFIADEPTSIPGGHDLGPGPYDYLLAALGACTAMTIRMYAEMKKLPLRRVSVVLKHEKIHAEDCAECETKEGKIDSIERTLTLDGELDPAARDKLLEIADKCPVHRTLSSEIQIKTQIR